MNRQTMKGRHRNMFAKSVNKRAKRWVIPAILLFLLAFSACSKNEDTNSIPQKGEYQVITAEEAKKMMDGESDYIILDVRTKEEFDEGHINNAVLIPDSEIKQRAEAELPQKDQLILVYCRSGRRSAAAAEELVSMGYTNVKDFGGISDWPYDIV